MTPRPPRFKSPRLQKFASTGNFLNRIDDALSYIRDIRTGRVRPSKLSTLANETGTIYVDAAISPASTATSSEPTDTGFTGVAMGGDGWTFSSVVWHFVAVAAGVLQVGINYLGQLIAGAGAVLLDEDGITIVSNGTYSDINSLKYKDGANYIFRMGVYDNGSGNTLSLVGESVAGDNSRISISVDPAIGEPGLVQIATALADFSVEDDGSGVHTQYINMGGYDSNTIVRGSGADIATFDAGLVALGVGGAAESGYKLKVTGKAKTSNDMDVASGLNVGTSTGAGVGDVYGSGELVMTGAGASSVGGAFTVGVAGFNHIVKTADQNKQSDTTLATDSALTVTLTASKTYAVRGRVWFDTPAAADFKYSITFAGTTLYCRHTYYPAGSSTGTTAIAATTPASATVLGTGTTAGFVEFDALCVVDGSNRAFNFQWAQNTSTASNTTVRAGSYIEYCQMA